MDFHGPTPTGTGMGSSAQYRAQTCIFHTQIQKGFLVGFPDQTQEAQHRMVVCQNLLEA
jgi:hypothetical protein